MGKGEEAAACHIRGEAVVAALPLAAPTLATCTQRYFVGVDYLIRPPPPSFHHVSLIVTVTNSQLILQFQLSGPSEARTTNLVFHFNLLLNKIKAAVPQFSLLLEERIMMRSLFSICFLSNVWQSMIFLWLLFPLGNPPVWILCFGTHVFSDIIL